MPRPKRDRKRQTKLNFSPSSKSSQVQVPSSSATSKPNLRSTNKPPRNLPVKASKRAPVDSSSESDNGLDDDERKAMEVGAPVKGTPNGMFRSSDIEKSCSEESSEDEVQVIEKPTKRKRRAETSDEEDEDLPVQTPAKSRKRQRQTKARSDTSDDELRLPSKRKKTIRRDTPEDDSEEDVEPRSSRQRARRTQIEDDEEEVEEEDDDVPPTSSRRRRARKPRDHDSDVERDNEEDEDIADIREDLAWLQSSPPQDRGKLRSTQEKPKNARQKALDALKAKRAGTNEPSSSATPSRRRTTIIPSDSESDSDLEIIKEESEEEFVEEDESSSLEEDRDANALDMFLEDEQDEGFINDDEVDGDIGEPSAASDLNELRLTLGLSRAKSKDLFKHAVEWMVMKKIHPGFDSTKNIYEITFRKLDDEVKGLAGSKFTSSVWGEAFTRAIRARPDFNEMEIGFGRREVMGPHCEACNRSGHPASFEISLTGTPYDPFTLELLEPESESESDSDSDSDISGDEEERPNGVKVVKNFAGERLPPESHRFNVGRTCKANAQVAHTLHHWRYHLYNWVKDYLRNQGHLTAEKLVKREKMSDRKREKKAQKIVDGMENDGEIRKLYRQYKQSVQFALEAQNDQRLGWGRR